ncbi:MAG: proline dehydrogenase family protein, partial [Phycisphaerae bacterium]
MKTASLEADIRRIGKEIFRRAEAAAPTPLSMAFWHQLVMRRLTQDDDLKMRAFRLIEVLPALKDHRAIARHIRDYFTALQEKDAQNGTPDLPAPLRLALRFQRPDSAYARLIAGAVHLGCGMGARRFIAGSTPAEAIASVRTLRREGAAFTMDVLGETVIADRVARHHQALYISLIEHLSHEARGWREASLLDRAPWGSLPRINISIKLTAIVPRFDPIDPDGAIDSVLTRLRPILRVARELGAFINIDMEHYAVKDLTLEIYRRVLMEPEFRYWPDCGIVIQTYMPESERDLASLIRWSRRRNAPITVRLVKGAYWDSETASAIRNGWPIPLFTEKWQSDVAFERVARLMLENADIVRPAFASHNVRSIAACLAMEDAT